MGRHGYGRAVVDTFAVIPIREATCPKCGSKYRGPKTEVKCIGCKTKMTTTDTRGKRKLPIGEWVDATVRRKSPGEVNGP